MNEIRYFVLSSAAEQRAHLSEAMPSLEEFWRYRLGTSATRVAVAVTELVIYLWELDSVADVG